MKNNSSYEHLYSDVPEVLKQYLMYLSTIKGHSKGTVLSYKIDLRLFFRFTKFNKGMVPKDFTLDDLEKISILDIDETFLQSITLMDAYEFLNFTLVYRKNSARSRARKTTVLRTFFKYIATHTQILSENPLENLERPSIKHSLPVFLNLQQSVQLLEAALEKGTEKTKFRDYCMITLFLNCGMRLSELVGINLSDFDLKSGKLKLTGKGNKERIIYLNAACKNAIETYIVKERNYFLGNNTQEKALFLTSTTGKRLGARRIQIIITETLKKAGLEKQGFSTHKLRHTAATLLYQEGHVDILAIKELLGHTNVGTTQIYTHVTNDTVRKIMDKNPLSSKIVKDSTSEIPKKPEKVSEKVSETEDPK